MKQEINIANLIKKFNEGDISQGELTLLMSHFKAHEPEADLIDFYQRTWDNSPVINNEINSPRLYAAVLKEIGVDKVLKHPTKSRRITIILNILKYAAVFILAFGISWIINDKQTQVKADNNNYGYQTFEVPLGSKSKLELPDGSRVVLNSGSKLRYQATFGKNSRNVFLEGEAYFDVKKDKTNPFYVNTSGIKIKVLGTSFNVKAYPDDKTIETTLITGAIEIYNSDNKKEETPMIILKPKQKAFYSKETSGITTNEEKSVVNADEISPQTISVENVEETELITAWKDDKFVFDNERFSDLIIRIERWFNVEIELKYPALKEARFSGKFDKETVEQAMKALTYVTPFHFEIIKNKILIYK